MALLRDVFLLLHFLGFASLLGGALVQVRADRPVINSAIRDGAWTQLATGLLLVGLLEMGTEPVNHLKVGIKLAVIVAILVIVLRNRRAESISRGTLLTILGLTAANVAIAVFV